MNAVGGRRATPIPTTPIPTTTPRRLRPATPTADAGLDPSRAGINDPEVLRAKYAEALRVVDTFGSDGDPVLDLAPSVAHDDRDHWGRVAEAAADPDRGGLWPPLESVSSATDYAAIAADLVAHWRDVSAPLLRVHEGRWWLWTRPDCIWRPLDPTPVGGGIDAVLRLTLVRATAPHERRDELVRLVATRALNAELAAEVSKLPGIAMAEGVGAGDYCDGGRPDSDVIPLANGDLHVTRDGQEVRPASSALFTMHRLAASWDGYLGTAPGDEPRWLIESLWRRLLRDSWPQDYASQALACQIAGAVLAGVSPSSVVGLIEVSGPSGTGKSVFLRVLEALAGGRGAAIQPETLGSRFDLYDARHAPLLGCDDARGRITPAGVGRLLSVAAGGKVRVERKGGAAEDVRLPGRVVVLSNHVIEWVEDAGMARRIVRLRMDRQVAPADRIPALGDLLSKPEHLRAVVADAVRGLRWLRGWDSSGFDRSPEGWIIPPYAAELARDAASAEVLWWRERIVRDAAASLRVPDALADLYRWQDTPEVERRYGDTDRRALLRAVRAMDDAPKIVNVRESTPDGRRPQVTRFLGVRLRRPTDPDPVN